MKSLGLIAGAALVVTALAPIPAAHALDPGSIAGVVTDDGAAPLPGIEVTVWDNVGYAEIVVGQDVTGADGSYQVDGIDPDPYYKVRFSDPTDAYATEWHRNVIAGTFATWVPVSENGVNTLPVTELEPAGSISGTVTVGAGAPVANAEVSVWWQYAAAAYARVGDYASDADGHYVIPGLPAATYSVSFYDPATGAAETWDDQTALMSATPITVASGEDVGGIDALLGGVVTSTAVPTIAGTPQVGQTLTATSRWTPANAAVTYRWVIGDDTTPADDPSGTTYVPTALDVGKSIRVQATATKGAGWVPATAWSAATAPVTAAPAPPPVVMPVMANHRLPLIKGRLLVGRTVRVTPGSWTPDPSRLDYAWYAGGRLIKRADRPRFTLTRKQLGKRLTVRVTASAPSYQPLTVRTARTAKVRR
ncbi:hypothetical protein ASC64_12575 [Nocardioides sp. Root122]|uniref:carboxypeptidase regulatory-like domain-containing protein n=1 Tax=Nocardioides TaxID=1839 RepID=UPI000714E732|nr:MULTISPECIES: carboxypeptidase regulatory-like domain-containing protein [Nocardioides]KQV65740.1 hypothetical protein ASC64_12575 [Nocardioides sp. Root122]MCK9825661.1 carboxypeptidase-like regulatory domain-containing protein [Nocardioides cavernae]